MHLSTRPDIGPAASPPDVRQVSDLPEDSAITLRVSDPNRLRVGDVELKLGTYRQVRDLPRARLEARTFREVEVLSRQTLSGLKPTATATQGCVVESRRR